MQEAPTHEPFAPALVAGIRHILGAPSIRATAIAATVVMALSGIGVAAQYSLVHGVGQHPAFLGVFTALLGGGSITASLTASRIIDHLGERWLAVIGPVNFAAGNLLRANHWLPAALIGTVVLGFALPYVFLATLNIAQRATPNDLQGRVSAALSFALFGPQALTQALGSALITHTTYIEIYIDSAMVSLVIASWLLLQRTTPPTNPGDVRPR
jgi:Major Facilitator Superfamily